MTEGKASRAELAAQLAQLGYANAAADLLRGPEPAPAPKPEPAPEPEPAATATGDVRHVVVRGIPLDVDVRRVRTWRGMELMAASQDPEASDERRLAAAVKFDRFVFGDAQMRAIVDALGGDEAADAADVSDVMREAMEQAAAVPKA